MTVKQKHPTPLIVEDLSRTVKSKFVYIDLWQNLKFLGQPATKNVRFYFESDLELDNSIIAGIQSHYRALNGGDIADGQNIIDAGTAYDEFVSGADILKLCLTLTDFNGKHFWENQVVYSLYQQLGFKNIKRLYNRVKMDQSFIIAYDDYYVGGVSPNNTRYLVPFTFYYIPIQR